MMINDSFVAYLKTTLSGLNGTGYGVTVLNEMNYRPVSDGLIFVFQGSTIEKADIARKMYRENFTISIYSEKDGFEASSDLGLSLFQAINDRFITLGDYVTKVTVTAPAVVSLYSEAENGYTNTLVMTGSLRFSEKGDMLVGPTITVSVDGNEVKADLINPVVSIRAVSNTDEVAGEATTYTDYYNTQVTFSCWLDGGELSAYLLDELNGNHHTFSYVEDHTPDWSYFGAVNVTEGTGFLASLGSTPSVGSVVRYTNNGAIVTVEGVTGQTVKVNLKNATLTNGGTFPAYGTFCLRCDEWSNSAKTFTQVPTLGDGELKLTCPTLTCGSVTVSTDIEKGMAALSVILVK